VINSSRLQIDEFATAILKGDRAVLAKAITLVESTRPVDQHIAGELLERLLPHTGNSLRIGITGAPGAGKSTFIEAFGAMLLREGKKVAVLTIDPTSQRTGGSILGDKTRMPELARDVRAFIRPSPSGSALGGVATGTRETILLCEAAGYDCIIVESVGTGQSEIALKGMVDFFLLLMLPGSGDELQGIKKGIVEMADGVVITKADGENRKAAQRTSADFQHALHFIPKQPTGWTPQVMLCSALEQTGLTDIWSNIRHYEETTSASGFLVANRSAQRTNWFKENFNFLLVLDPSRFASVLEEEAALTKLVQSQELFPRKAAQQLLDAYHQAVRRSKE
jgi:LAO/AO transport system kinase